VSDQEILIGTRGSALALAQARLVAAALETAGWPARLVIVETEGDRRAPDTAWGEGAFVAAIERALLAGRVDLAVHSAKDVPTEEDPRLRIGAFLARADPRDALVVRADSRERRLDDLAAGRRVGTDSPRRVGFVLARRPDLLVHPLHGNVDTRLRRLDDGETDALVLAAAGLDRLGRADRIAERLDLDVVLPAPGQGAIAIQIRRDDARLVDLTAAIDDRPTRLAVEAERAFLLASGGGCRAPIGALATVEGDQLVIVGGYVRPDGSAVARDRVRGPAADGRQLGAALAGLLGARLPNIGRDGDAPTAATVPAGAATATRRPRVIVARAADQAAELIDCLAGFAIDGISVPAIAVAQMPAGGDLDRVARDLARYQWAVVTSANGVRAIVTAVGPLIPAPGVPKWAAIGAATRRALEDAGFEVEFVPGQAVAIAIAAELPAGPGDRVLLLRGDLADEELPDALRARGVEVDDVVAYRTVEAPDASRALLRRAIEAGRVDAVLFTSGSTVRGLVALAAAESLVDVTAIPAICIGPKTALEARRLGFHVLTEAPSRGAQALAAATARALAAQPQEIR
jgi:hydroxymethylbilane synthase